jgi:aspartate aminotransferase
MAPSRISNMYADRIAHLKPEGAYAVLARAQALEAQGKKIIHLEIGQPDFPTPKNVADAGVTAIRDGMTKYTAPAGIPHFRKVIADSAGKQRGIKVEPGQVVVGPGSKPGLFFPTLALVSPGDEVIYPDPGFPTYEAMIRIAGGIPVPIPLKEENQFSFDLDYFDSKISDRTRLVVLNSPGNPTGGVIPFNDLNHIAEKVIQHDTWVISDEIYTQLTYEGVNARSITEINGMQARTVIVDGFSKTYSMTGWRLGYMIAPVDLANKLELLITHATGSTAAFTQIAGIEALTGPQDFVNEMVREYQMRRDRMLDLINAIPGVHAQTPQGAFYLFPNIKQTGLTSSQIAARLIDEAGVAILSGTDFGAGGEGYIRLVYATSMEVIEEGIGRMADWFRTL